MNFISNIHKHELNLRTRNNDGKRQETLTCHGCYGNNSVLAIKINTVSAININSFSSADKSESTGDFATLSKFY